MQLVAYGAQDIYLTGNPQITFFKVVYRRHTNFSMEAVAQTFSGGQAAGARVTSTITRNGDLIGKMYYQFNPVNVVLNNNNVCGANIGNSMFNEIVLEIGGQEIDKHYGHWFTVWDELTIKNPVGWKGAIGVQGAENPQAPSFNKMSYNHIGVNNKTNGDNSAAPVFATVPLKFWFNRNPGLALPLIALQYHEVKVHITFSGANAVNAGIVFGPDPQGQLWVDYIYLDTDERRRFAQQSHEYLIEQLQFEQIGANQNEQLNFNHPVKELIWTGLPNPAGNGTATSTASPTAIAANAVDRIHLKLNGHNRMAPRHPFYYTRTQIYQHHSGFGGTTVRDSIGVYSFALKPEEHQPSGTCNFSRIDNAQLVRSNPAALNVYAVNYNVLRIMSGMGGLAYSN